MTTLTQVTQAPNPGDRIELFRFDATPAGGQVYYFTTTSPDGNPVVFGGVTYNPFDIEFEGFQVNGTGSLPQPTMRIATTNGVFQGVVNTFGDLLGCEIQRLRTFKRFLDGEPDEDPTAYIGPDKFLIERKVSENPIYVEWQLSAAIDQEGKMLPGRRVIRDTCPWRYRIWNATAGSFDYSKAQCPYTGSNYYDRQGSPTTAANDRCGRRISDCRLRFGAGNELPFGGFPGAARING